MLKRRAIITPVTITTTTKTTTTPTTKETTVKVQLSLKQTWVGSECFRRLKLPDFMKKRIRNW